HVHRSAGVRQHFQHVVFWLRRVGFGLEDARVGPALLPLGFNRLRVVGERARLSCGLPALRRRIGSLVGHADQALFFLALLLELFLAAFLAPRAPATLRARLPRWSLAIFFFNSGVSIEKLLSAAGPSIPASFHNAATFLRSSPGSSIGVSAM